MGLVMATTLMAQALVPAGALSAKAAGPKLSAKSVSIKVGKTKVVSVKKAKGYKITVKSKNKKIVTVKKKGKFAFAAKGVKAGNTTVTVKAKKKKKIVNLKCKVTVVKADAANDSAEQTSSASANAATASANAATNSANPAVASVAPSAAPVASGAPGVTEEPFATGEPATIAPTVAPTVAPTEAPFVCPEFVTAIPEEYNEKAPAAAHQGTFERIKYNTETYDEGESVAMEKEAWVYLPYGYDKSKKYNVLYLMHGGGENMHTWFKRNDYTGNTNMVDNMIEKGVIDPLIIVTPTFYRAKGAPKIDDNSLPAQFQYELRKDLIPYVESHYSTYTEGNVSDENLIKTRMHRAFAGLSMGSMTTYRAALYGNYDVFAWFGPYSGCTGPSSETVQDQEADKIIKVIQDGEKNGYKLGFMYCGNGTKDIAYEEHKVIMEKAVAKSDVLKPGYNYDFITIPDGSHDMWSWHIHLYNSLRVFFTKE